MAPAATGAYGQAVDAASVGQGTVHESYRDEPDRREGAIHLSMPHEGDPRPMRSHYRLSQREAMKGAANRFVHSTTYLWLYGGMAAGSFITVLLSLSQTCPGALFYSLELIINATLIAEVGMRCFAFGRQFWKSTLNIVDLCLVLLCAITLAVIFYHHDCSDGRSGRGEELLDSVLLIVRNVAQGVRLIAVVRRSRSNVTGRVPAIDLSAAQGHSIDFDLEEEGDRARERMALGGDHSAQQQWIAGGRARSAEERTLFEDDDL